MSSRLKVVNSDYMHLFDVSNIEVRRTKMEEFDEWLADEKRKAVQQQQETTEQPNEFMKLSWESGVPYTGAIGTDITYEITPTSLGAVIKARYNLTGNVFDFTDYENW